MTPQAGSDNFIKFDDEIIKEVGAILNKGHNSELTPPFYVKIFLITLISLVLILLNFLLRHSEAENDTTTVPGI